MKTIFNHEQRVIVGTLVDAKTSRITEVLLKPGANKNIEDGTWKALLKKNRYIQNFLDRKSLEDVTPAKAKREASQKKQDDADAKKLEDNLSIGEKAAELGTPKKSKK